MGILSLGLVALVVLMVVLQLDVVQGEQDPPDNKNSVFSLEERNLLALGKISVALGKMADHQAQSDKKGPISEISQLVSVVNSTQQQVVALQKAMSSNVESLTITTKQLASGLSGGSLDTNPECPSPYQSAYTQCILIVEDKKTWEDAKDHCASSYGGQLAEVKDLSVFTSYLKQNHEDGDALLWVGGSDLHAENDWRWPSGGKVNPFYWGINQPDNWYEEHCMNIDKNQVHLNDLDCEKQLGFICEKVFKSSIVDELIKGNDNIQKLLINQFSTNDPPTDCPSPYESMNSQCILVVADKKNWDDALQSCADKAKGQLAQVNDLAVLVKYLKDKYPDGHGKFWVGGSDRAAENDWRWLSGGKVNPYYWGPNQPDNWGDEHCMNIQGSVLNDQDCGQEHGFICEIVTKNSIADETNKKLLSVISAVEKTQETVKTFAEAAKESATGNAHAATTMANLQQFLVNHLTKNDQQTGGSSGSSITPNPIRISANSDIMGLADIINKTHNLVQQQIIAVQSDTSQKFELMLNAINSTQNSVEVFAKATADAINKLQQAVIGHLPDSDCEERVISPDSTTNSPPVECGPPYVAIGTDCLRLSTDKLDWTSAREACKLEDADLAMPDDLDRLRTYIIENDLRADYWVGGSDRLIEGEWAWLDGRAVDSEGWMPGQPDNLHSDLDCLDFRSEYSPSLNNYRCQNPQKYICEKTNVNLPDIEIPVTTFAPDGSCSPPWNLIGNECFRVYSNDGEQKSWESAQKVCKDQGGDLAEPDNMLALRIYLLNNELANDYWVGGSYSEDEAEWRWVSGRTAHPAPIPIPPGYLPPNLNMNLHCLDFRTQRSPSVYPYRCSESQRFICEKLYEGTAAPIPTLPTVSNDTCGSPYFLVGGECFRISDGEEDWESAMLRCQSEGGSLATPSNLDLLRRHLVSTGDVNDYWLGAHDKEGTWKWITGDLVEDAWQTGQPSGSAGEDCLDFRVGQSPSLNDYMCQMPQKYLCERPYSGTVPSELPTTTPEPGSCNLPWIRIGSECYRIHSDEAHWAQARNNCQREGGDLAQPNDLRALRMHLQENGITKDYWIGGRDEGDSWKWLSGRAIIDQWVPGEPAGNGDSCLDFRSSRNPSLNDYSCTSSQPYICERGEESVTNPTTTQSPGTIACGGGSYFELNGQCFAPYHGEKTWDAAREACQQEGGDLAEPADLNKLRTALNDKGFTRDSWIGGSDRQKEGHWKWLSGQDITGGWIQGEPQSTGGDSDDCLDFRISRNPSLNDYTCHKAQPYICQRTINSSYTAITTANPADNSKCPDGYLIIGSECFRIYENQVTWDSARETCRTMRGDLAQPKNFETLRRYLNDNGVARDYWIGGHDDGSGWKWLSGAAISSDLWIPGKPDKRGMENCLDFRADRNPSLNDYKCHADQRFICQAPCPASYFQVGSQCFSINAEKKTWSDARTVCQGNGGDLASPLDLNQLKTVLKEKSDALGLWLGGSDSATPGTWKWLSGKPITNQWFPGHPKSSNSCLTLPMSDGLVVSDTECTDTLSFVCEVKSNAPAVNPDSDKVCSSPYHKVGDQCYRIMAEKQNWAVARQKCKEDQGDLATPRDIEALREHVVASNHDSDFWIGGSDTGVEGEWRWVSSTGRGELIQLGAAGGWDDNQPEGGKSENCLDFRAGRAPREGAGPSTSRCLNDFRCTVTQPFICERKITETGEYVTESVPVTIDTGCPDMYFPIGQECFHPKNNEAKNWDDARTACQAEGGDLAQPSDLDSLRLYLIENNLVHDYWLGGSDINEEGRWEWLNGSHIINGWMPHKPDSGTRENCLDFRVDTRPSLNDFICGSAQPFICQQPMNSGRTDAITDAQYTTVEQEPESEPEAEPEPEGEPEPEAEPEAEPTAINNTVTQIPLDEPCPDDFFSLDSECFLVVAEKINWKEARSYCQNKGGDLAQPNDLSALRSYLKQKGIDEDYWIGGSDTEVEGTFKWLNGTEITEGWALDQPGGDVEQNCLDFRAQKVPDSLNDYTCTNGQKFICER